MFAPHTPKLAGHYLQRLFPVDGHERLAAAALAARTPVLQPTRSYHRASDAKGRMHRVRDRLDQRRGVGIKVERDGADHIAVLDDGVEGAPMRMMRNKLAVHITFAPAERVDYHAIALERRSRCSLPRSIRMPVPCSLPVQ